MNLKIAAISDIHGMWDRVNYPQADVLVLAGDILKNYHRSKQIDSTLQLMELESLNDFLKSKKDDGTYKEIILVAGNHDFAFERETSRARNKLKDVVYLQDSSFEFGGFKFYGSPWTPWFYDWAFNLPNPAENPHKAENYTINCWNQIPDDTDILITHGPPKGIGDKIFNGKTIGCSYLLDRIRKLNLKAHFFGHIHYSYGITVKDGTFFVNAAACNEEYKPDNPVQVVTLFQKG